VTPTVVLPHRVALDERVSAGAWTDEHGRELATLEEWDYTTPVRLRREVEVDVAGVRGDCGLEEEPLACIVVWRASKTGLRGAGAGAELSGPRVREVMEVGLEGPELGGVLHLTTRVVLGAGTTPRPLTARLPGTVLWQDTAAIALEGSAARFPMEVLDFHAARLPAADAPWYLDWPRDGERFEEPMLGALRLFLNSRHPAIGALVSGEMDAATAGAVTSMMRLEVARTMLVGALAEDDFVEGTAEYPDGSVGAALHTMIGLYWPDESPGSLRSQLRAAPQAFEAQLQERLRFLAPEA